MPFGDVVTTNEPKSNDAFWLSAGFGSLLFLALAYFVGGQEGAGWFIVILTILALGLVVFGPRDLPVGMTRLAAIGIWILLMFLTAISGWVLVIAELLSPIAQHLQDEGDDAGKLVNVVWVGFVAGASLVIAIIAGRLWASRNIMWILLSGFVMAAAFIPAVGMVVQEMFKNPH